MKILYLNPSGQLGGAEVCLLTVLRALPNIHPDWECHLIAGEDGPLVPRAAALGVRVSVLPFPVELGSLGESRNRNSAVTLVRTAKALLSVRTYRNMLRKAMAEIAPDLIHTNGIKMHLAGAFAANSATPIVCHVHDYIGARPLTSRLMKLAARRYSAFIANSKSVAADTRRWCSSMTPVVPIYNGVDLNLFSPEGPVLDLDRLCGLPPAGPTTVRFGLIGTFAKWKGHVTFLDAISRLPRNLDIRAYVIGGPIYQTQGSQHSVAELSSEAQRLGITGRVGFTGFVDHPADAMRSLDVVVHASTSPEPFGMVIAEAMACGRAVIAGKSGGAAELFDDGVTALGHEPGNAAGLTEAMRRLATAPDLRTRLGRNAREAAVLRFSDMRMASEIASLYREVVPVVSSDRVPVAANPAAVRDVV